MHDKNKEYCAAVIVKMAKKSKELVDQENEEMQKTQTKLITPSAKEKTP